MLIALNEFVMLLAAHAYEIYFSLSLNNTRAANVYKQQRHHLLVSNQLESH
jgi:hypothetical protein